MPAIRTDRPPGGEFRTLARRTLSKLTSELRAAGKGEGVHGARKRLKFMRSLLRLIEFSLGQESRERADRLLKEAHDALAGPRRAEALQEAVGKLEDTEGSVSPALRELSDLVGRAHGAEVNPEALDAAASRALQQIDVLGAEVSHWPLAKCDIALYLKGIGNSYRQARKKMKKGLAARDVKMLHRARMSAIHHLHHLEILERLWPKMIREWAAELLKLREALGDLNDLEEIAALIASHSDAFSSEATRALAGEAVSARRGELFRRAEKLDRHLFAEKPSHLTQRIGAMWKGMLD
jgi:CHAD domain-containing protein